MHIVKLNNNYVLSMKNLETQSCDCEWIIQKLQSTFKDSQLLRRYRDDGSLDEQETS